MAKKVLYKCKECGHEWKTKPPLFTSLHFCEKQGCKGTAYPQEDTTPTGMDDLVGKLRKIDLEDASE